MNYGDIDVSISNHIALLEIQRPPNNFFDVELMNSLADAFEALDEDLEVRALVLASQGKHFCAGANFSARERDPSQPPSAPPKVEDGNPLYAAGVRLFACKKPVIAAIHGFCIGGGSELALACDIRVADRTARLSQAEIRIGLIPGGGGTQRLARLVGRGQAMLISCTGDFVDAEEAHRMGWVEVLVDEGQHLDKAVDLAGRMARWSSVSLRLAKQAVNAAFEKPLKEGMEYEKELFLEAFASEDGREGVKAFMEKRKPDFKGR